MYYFLLIVFFLTGALISHVFHELMHYFVGRLVGLKFIRIQWFTFHGGTKVCFEDEPDFNNENVKVSWQWGATSVAGIIGTSLLGYIMTILFFFLPANYFRLFVWTFIANLLLNDTLYALLGSLNENGDTYCVRMFLGWSRMKILIASAILLAVNFSVLFSTIR